MPERVSEPRQKTEKEKEADKKLLEEIENDPYNPKGATHDEGEVFDPLQVQAEALPNSIKGSDGDKPHVLPVGGDQAMPEESLEDDEELGGGVGDPSQLTAD